MMPPAVVLVCCLGLPPTVWTVAPEVAAHDLCPRLTSHLEGARLEALERAATGLGLTPGARPIHWILTATVAPSPSAADRRFVAGHTEVRDEKISVTLPAFRYLRRPRKARPVVLHETAHAVLASVVRRTAHYEALPPWFREGLALHLSGEGRARVEAQMATTVLGGGGASGFLVGFSATNAHPTPAEGYLAVRWLSTRKDGGLRDLLQRFVAGTPLERALDDVFGLSRHAFATAASRAAVRTVREWLPPAAEDLFRGAFDALSAGDHARARAGFEALLARKSAPLESSTRYFLARSLVAAGDHRGAAVRLEPLVEAAVEVLWEPEALYLLGECHERLGEPGPARRHWQELVERFPDDVAVAARARRRLSSLSPAAADGRGDGGSRR